MAHLFPRELRKGRAKPVAVLTDSIDEKSLRCGRFLPRQVIFAPSRRGGSSLAKEMWDLEGYALGKCSGSPKELSKTGSRIGAVRNSVTSHEMHALHSIAVSENKNLRNERIFPTFRYTSKGQNSCLNNG